MTPVALPEWPDMMHAVPGPVRCRLCDRWRPVSAFGPSELRPMPRRRFIQRRCRECLRQRRWYGRQPSHHYAHEEMMA